MTEGPWSYVCVRERGSGLSISFVRPSAATLRGLSIRAGLREDTVRRWAGKGAGQAAVSSLRRLSSGGYRYPTATLPGMCRRTTFSLYNGSGRTVPQ